MNANRHRSGPAGSPLPRRTFIRAGLAAAALAVVPHARAQAAFPARPVTIVVPSAAGGALDLVARRLGHELAEQWGRPVVVENRAGGMGTIGTRAVVRAESDGHTILLINAPLVQVPWMMELPYDPLTDLVPVVQLSRSYSMLAVHRSSPANTLEEFIAMVKARPGHHSYGSWGRGTTTHLYGVMLSEQAGLDMIHVPYNGAAPMITALVARQVDAAFVDPGSAKVHLDSLKLLASVGTSRMPDYPELPTLREKGFHSFDSLGWMGFFVPAGTPGPVVTKIAEDVSRAMRQPAVVESLRATNVEPDVAPPDAFADLVRSDSAFWGKIMKDAGVTAAN